MFLGGLLLAVIFSLLLTAVIAAGVGGRRTLGELLPFFLLVFLAAWAGGIWLGAGPMWWDFYWVPAIIIGVVVSLIFILTTRPPATDTPLPEEEAAESMAEVAVTFLGLTVWIWVFLLAIAVIIGLIV